jgi:hypothetical protein
MRTIGVTVACALLLAVSTSTQQPSVQNGQVVPQVVSGSLDRAFRDLAAKQTEPAWIGYAMPAIPGEHQMCCWSNMDSFNSNNCCNGCNLEPGTPFAAKTPANRQGPVPLEPGRIFFVLYRIEAREVSRIRIFSEECPLDGGGRTIHWLTGVRSPDSIALLASFTSGTTTRKLADSAVGAIAMHGDPAALERLTTMARNDQSSGVRGQALFWLAQRAGEKAVGTINDAIDRDPDTDVKRRAVFALSQLPKDEGVPRLIEVARAHSNPAVRKQAIFWLGQSKDPRALRFFEEILFKK